MLASIDSFLQLQYENRHFNCLHLVAKAWLAHTGNDIWPLLKAFHEPTHEQLARRRMRQLFVEIKAPVNPCLVLWQRRKSVPHVGIYLRGRVLHIHEGGVEFELLATACKAAKTSARFYVCKP